MLHILLTILKVIGIIALVILALLAAIVLIVLFAPFRYRLHMRKEDGPLEAEVKVTWLLKLLAVNGQYRRKSGVVHVTALGRTLKTIRIPAGHVPAEKSPGKEEPAKEPPVKESVETPPVTEPPAEARPVKESPAEAKPLAEPSETPPVTEPSETPTGKETAAGRTPESESSAGEAAKEEKSAGSTIRRILEQLPQKVSAAVEKICNVLLRLLDLPLDLYDRADDGIDRIEQKIRAIRKKAAPFLSLEAEHMLRKLIGYLLYLIRAWKPRTIKGYIEFGSGMPDVTGKLAGLIWLLLPEEAEEFDICPDFYEKRLRTDVVVTGKIRLYRAAVVAFRVLLDREFWELLGMIRGKPSKKKKQRVRKVS